VEAGILWPAAHTSRHLGCVRRQHFGRVALQAMGSQVGTMLHLERLTSARAVLVIRALTGKITSSPAKPLIGTATGIGITTTFGVAIAAAL
jgi:hypothetical protein